MAMEDYFATLHLKDLSNHEATISRIHRQNLTLKKFKYWLKILLVIRNPCIQTLLHRKGYETDQRSNLLIYSGEKVSVESKLKLSGRSAEITVVNH